MFKPIEEYKFSLENFEGPLNLLLHLVKKRELDIYEVPLVKITRQYLDFLVNMEERNIDAGAELLGIAAAIMYIKSRMLIPFDELDDEKEEGPLFDTVQQILDYCRIKSLSEGLLEKEKEQAKFYSRGADPFSSSSKRPAGIEHLSLEDLKGFFLNAMKKAKACEKSSIAEERWLVQDKILWIKDLLSDGELWPLKEIFSLKCCREEIIAIFLAMLELMKAGSLRVLKDARIEGRLLCKKEEN